MKSTFRTVVILTLCLTLVATTGSVLHADDTTGAGEVLSVERVGEFVSLMTEASAEAEASSMTVDGNLEELDNAPEAELEDAAKFVAEQFELAQSSPQSVTIIDRAHTAINDELVLCLEMKQTSPKGKLAFHALEFCQGVGTNLLHRLTLMNDEGETLATYTLESFTK